MHSSEEARPCQSSEPGPVTPFSSIAMPYEARLVRSTFVFLVLSSSLGIVWGEYPDYPMTFADMKVLAGYYTEDGKYLGGIPKADPVSKEIYECAADTYFYPSGNDTVTDSADGTGEATACLEWRADESAGGIFQKGTCECTSIDNESYCSAWTCNQVKQEEECNSSGSNCVVSTNTDAVLCQCDLDVPSGLYCDSWSCKQIDSDGREEFEEYHCQREAESGHYCEAWNGNVTATDEVEVVTCECVATWNGDRLCSYWECEEIGLSSCNSTKGWCDLGLSIGLAGVFGLAGALAAGFSFASFGCFEQSTTGMRAVVCMGIGGILWCMVWSVGVVIWGGVDGVVYVGIMWGVSFLLAANTTGCILYDKGRPK
ncbi:unnamed protein product [Ectocarpus sp. CCAP 1310/34]|nr:unnamed protein product [Ectocarpus sp. CCAP 1310/34]